jgi:hypothetical protein
MGWLDRTKAALGLGGAPKRTHGDGRPPLKDLPPASPAASLDDALEARDAGRLDEARSILRAIDRGKGLRTVLRAGAALEAGDEEELVPLTRAIAESEPGWRLALQTASALNPARAGEGPMRETLLAHARAHGAPIWALSWANPTVAGKVDLLFADAPLARLVAAREWKIEGAQDDREAIERYATFAHGRDAIQRFGAIVIAQVFARAFEPRLLGGFKKSESAP